MTDLRQRQNMHARLQGGAMYGYDIFDRDRGDKVVGTIMIHINKKTRPWTETKTYVLLDHPMTEFKVREDFVAAYEKKLKEQNP